MNDYQADSADIMIQVSQWIDQVRNTVQEMIHGRLAQRRPVFFG